MSNHDTDLLDLDPTEDDLADLAEQDDSADDVDFDSDDLDFDSNYRDDRYDTEGIPSWSAFA